MQRVSQVCRIVADTFERRSGIPNALRAEGFDVDLAQLAAGDYDLGAGVLVERKTVADFHLTLERGRLWDQIVRLRQAARLPYLLIEGGNLDAGTIRPAALRGACLAVNGQGVALLRTSDATDTVLWLRLLAQRVNGARLGRDRPRYAQRLKPPSGLASEAMIAAVPGISVRSARALLECFGSVSAVVAAEDKEWMAALGLVRLAPRHCVQRSPSHSRRRREWQCPATHSVVDTSVPGGIHVASSDRAEPRHLRGSP